MRVIITGANGFIGSRLANEFAENDVTVYAIVKDNLENVSNIINSNIHIIYCNLDNINELCEKKEIYNCDVFYNFAWNGVSTLFKNDFDIQYKNIQLSMKMIEVAKRVNCKKFVGIGSTSEFAYSEDLICGNEVPSPSDYYSVAKVATRLFCELFAKKNNMKFNWVLITSVYGPGRDDNNLITYTIKSLLRNETPEYTNLDQQWDYIYIDDVIRALYLIGIYGKDNQIYSIGSGKERQLKEYVYEIRQLIDPKAELKIGSIAHKTNQIDNSLVDISKLINDTGYSESVTFEEGIKKTIEYFAKKHNYD